LLAHREIFRGQARYNQDARLQDEGP